MTPLNCATLKTPCLAQFNGVFQVHSKMTFVAKKHCQQPYLFVSTKRKLEFTTTHGIRNILKRSNI